MKYNIKALAWLPYQNAPALFLNTMALNEKNIHEFKSLLNALNVKPNDEQLKEGLSYFRNCYQTRPFNYPGDFVYYEMLKAATLKGNSLEKALELAKYIIDREMDFLDVSKALGEPYTESWIDY